MQGLEIRDVRFFLAEIPTPAPIADATHVIPAIRIVVAEIELASGVIGQGYLLAFHFNPMACAGALLDIRELVKEFRANETGLLRARWDLETEYFGQEGLLRWAGAVVNVAMWDAWGRTLDAPIWKILGTAAQSVPVYGSGGWLSYSDDELIAEVTGYARRGFGGVKIKVGAKEPGRDLHRLSLVREAVGARVNIMMDANQGLDAQSALALAESARQLGITWFEEPVHHRDYAGFQFLRQRAGIALAMGEREYDCEALKALIARDAIDLWQPDLLRLAGVEGWLESAALARAHRVPVLPHYYKDYDVPLLCAIPNGFGAESFDWIDPLIDRPLAVVDGRMAPREGAGWGFNFKTDGMREIQ